MEENTQLPKEVVDRIFQEGQNMLAFAPDNKWSYIQGATAYATKLQQANETIKVLTYDNNRLKGEVEGLTSALDELRTKYDNILATESGHESKTENVWQSGYAAGHEAGCERGKREAKPGARWPLFVIDKATGERHQVNKVVYHSENEPEPHVWCDTWYGHHVIGNDCDWAGERAQCTPASGGVLNLDTPILDDADLKAWEKDAAGREEAVEFAQWLATERWQPRINTEWARYETVYSDVSVKTTGELYKLFKQQKENP